MRFISEDIEDLVGYPAGDFTGAERRYGSLIHPADRAQVVVDIERALEQGSPYSLSYRLLHADGSVRWVAEHGRAVLDDNGERAWLDGVILDISERMLAEEARDRAQQELRQQAELNRHQALHDSLTGLPNRVLFGEHVDLAIDVAVREGSEFTLLLMDLDRFKDINDTLGHAAGDQLLTEIAGRLRGALRPADSFARLGGDEFACLIPGASASAALQAAERIREAVYELLVLDDLPIQVEASIGIAIFPEHGTDGNALLRHADVAMYAAKQTGDGQCIYDPEQDTRAPASLALVGELRRALAERELILHYQPKIVLKTGRVTGVEALVRWRHPTRGLLGPDEFIPLAQETGLIRPLTLYVIGESLRQCQRWRARGHELTVAVNVSVRNLIDARFPDDVQRLLRQRGVPAALLELEITETAIVSDPYRCKTVLDRLSGMGIRLAVDDFGTGYTSLGYLRRLPINELKIDRSFVANMLDSADDAVIVRSTIDLGQNLGLEVVAEGVENEAALADLQTLGCDVAQGFHVSRPVAGEELMEWLERLPVTVGGPQWAAATKSDSPVRVGHGRLSIEDVVRVSAGTPATLDEHAREEMEHSRRVLERPLDDAVPIYGLTTGVGPQNGLAVNRGEQAQFNRLMVLAHCVGHGERAPIPFVRAAMLVRSEGLARAATATRPEVVDAMLAALNAGVTPNVHIIGSLGQSDLAPLAEIARALIGDGPDAASMKSAGLPALELEPGEGLALISANAFSIGIAALASARAETALRALELSAALACEGFAANVAAIDPSVATLRPHAGIQETIDALRALLAGGALLNGTLPPARLQDPLCFRVIPQVHGATRHALSHARSTIETELRSASDNPALVSADGRTIANGNHDSTPLVIALDHARLGLAQAVTIANERIQKLLDDRFSGLPTGLRARADLPEDGLGAVGHGASALAAETRLLACPVSLEQPTSSAAAGIEDRITLAPVGARRLYEMATHAIRLAAVELLCGAQAVDLRNASETLGDGTASAYHAVRSHLPFTRPGQAPPDDLEPLVRYLQTR
jgi:histidine ammonia-lyase